MQVHSRIHKKKNILRATEISTGVSMTVESRRRREATERGNGSAQFLSRFLADVVTPGMWKEEEKKKKKKREKHTIRTCVRLTVRRVASRLQQFNVEH